MTKAPTLAAHALAATSVAGCASTNHLLAGEPDEVFHSAHSPDEVAACFSKRNRVRIIERSDGAKVARFRNGYGGVAQTFSIYPEGQGSRIETRHNFVGMPAIRWKRCVGLEPMRPEDMGPAPQS